MDLLSLKELLLGGGGVLLILLTLVQIAPIKVNPWSAIGRAIGRAINGELIKKVDDLNDKVATLDDRVVGLDNALGKQNAINARVRILRFGDEMIHGQKHTKDHFDQTLSDIAEYEKYCDEHKDFENGKTRATAAKIKDRYNRCMEENSFL